MIYTKEYKEHIEYTFHAFVKSLNDLYSGEIYPFENIVSQDENYHPIPCLFNHK